MTLPAAPVPARAASPADTIAAQLRDHLDAEIAVHRQLLHLAEEKQRVVVAADGAALNALLERERAPLAESVRCRQFRERILRTAASVWNIPAAQTTLSRLCERLPEVLRAEILRRGHELRQLVERLRAVNDRNQVLIRHGLGLVRELVATVTGAPAAGAYDRRGIAPGAGGASGIMLDLRT
jgi:flagellar biosynthesis/type III secretory pathway chaperone